MDKLYQILIYPLQRLAVLVFSLEVADGISVGALLVSAMILIIVFRGFIGIHLRVFDNDISEPKEKSKIGKVDTSDDSYWDHLRRNY